MAEERAQRRLAAILAADVVGYSRLMERDEEGTLSALKERRKRILDPLVTQYQGRIVKLMGDGVLVEFASAVNAVSCAVELQKRMAEANGEISDEQRIVLRVGINLGDVIVEHGDLYGDGVNVAARLEALADPGGICLSGALRDQVERQLALNLDDLGEQSLKNIARPVHVYRISSIGTPNRAVPADTQNPLSIAVLPFDNMSGTPEQGYIGDGIAENIITDLSRFRDLAVIARNSTFAYKGKSTRVQDIRRELGVNYVLEGSVQRAGERIRVTAQLVEAATGRHVWVERYDRPVDDLFAVMDDVTGSIVGTLGTTYGGRLRKAAGERAPGTGPPNFRAFDHFVQGMEQLNQFTKASVARGIAHFEQAVALNPNYAKAHSKIAWGHLCDIALGYSGDTVASMSKARAAAETAVRCDDAEAWSHWAIAGCAFYSGQHDSALTGMRRALELNPNDADVLTDMGLFCSYSGRADEGLEFALKAMRLNPHYPEYYAGQLGIIFFDARRYGDAVRAFESARNLDPPLWRLYLAASHAALGHHGVAHSTISNLLASEPGATVAHYTGPTSAPYRNDLDREHLVQHLRKAGLPE
jgi:adenylate cyclase